MSLNVTKEVALLKQMTVGQLRELYLQVTGEATQAANRKWLVRRIIWRMQSIEEGGLSERAIARARELASGADLRTTIDVQQRNHVECERLRDEKKSLARQMRDDHAKLQAIVTNPNIASNLSGLSEIQSRLETADQRSQQIASEFTALDAKRIDDQQITNVLAGFDELWQSLPPKEQVRLVRLLIESVSFDGPGGNVAITFHPTGLKSLTENQLEHAQ